MYFSVYLKLWTRRKRVHQPIKEYVFLKRDPVQFHISHCKGQYITYIKIINFMTDNLNMFVHKAFVTSVHTYTHILAYKLRYIFWSILSETLVLSTVFGTNK
jgi:hypothetical protein